MELTIDLKALSSAGTKAELISKGRLVLLDVAKCFEVGTNFMAWKNLEPIS
jgi:hypothetical protein